MEKTDKQINENAACWYVVFATAKAEMHIKKQLEQAGYETFLPLRSVKRAWGEHKKTLLLPVLPGLIFVHLSEDDVAKVADLKGLSFLLKSEEEYVTLPDNQIELFRSHVEEGKGLIEFTLDDLVQNDRNVRIKIENLGTAILEI